MTFERKSFQCFFVGTVTDGEFNSLSTMGGKRPISIIQVMMDVKAEARSINVNTIRKYITPKRIQGIFFLSFFSCSFLLIPCVKAGPSTNVAPEAFILIWKSVR